tara:strand:- start:373 stop:690 length:318 start_codon:yes stop_codon:yes gene_type:complete
MVDHLLDVEDDLRMVHHNEKVHPFQLQRLKLYSLHKNMRNEFNQDPDTNHQQILRHRQVKLKAKEEVQQKEEGVAIVIIVEEINHHHQLDHHPNNVGRLRNHRLN